MHPLDVNVASVVQLLRRLEHGALPLAQLLAEQEVGLLELDAELPVLVGIRTPSRSC